MALAALFATSRPSHAQLSATSGWPMLGYDVRHTGQSNLLGPKFAGAAPGPSDVRALTFYDKIKMFPVTGPNGEVYVGMGWQFCALNPLNVTDPTNPVFTTKWNVPGWPNAGCAPLNADVSASSPAVDQNNYVYLGDRDNSVYKFRGSDGVRMWTYNHGHEGDHHASPAIAADGTVYFAFSQNSDGNGSILAVKDTGNVIIPAPAILPDTYIKWKFGVGQYATTSSPTLTTDLDSAPLIILGFADSKVRAIRDNGTSAAVKWKTTIGPGVGAIAASPVISADGRTVYIGGYGGMYALDAIDGHIKWTFPTSPANVDSTAALSSGGILYFVARNGNQRIVYAINPAGLNATPNPSAQAIQNALLWTYGPITASLSSAGGFPIIGADGIVYVTMANGVYALQPNSGALLWQYLSTNGIMSGPALGKPVGDTAATSQTSGTAVLYFGSQDHKVYAIKSKRTGLTQNDPPVPHLQISPGVTVQAGTEITFNASTSTDPNGDQLFFNWDLGDGTTATGSIVHHTYWAPCASPNPCVSGAYPVTLVVTDGMASTTFLPKPNISVTGGGTSFFCDAFTRANSSTLGSPGAGAPPCPSPSNSALTWQEDSGAFAISANQLVTETQPVGTPYIATVSGFTGLDQAVAVDFTSTLNSNAPKFGIVLRYTDPQNYYLLYRWVGGASVLRISKIVNGLETVLAQAALPNPTQNVPFRLRASAAGTALSLQLCPSAGTCSPGGTTVSVSNSTFQNGRVGVLFKWGVSATPSYIADNLKACVGPPGAVCSPAQ